MKRLACQLSAYAVGIYLTTGFLDGTWNPLLWSGRQWAANVLAIVIVLSGSWAWNRWKARRQ